MTSKEASHGFKGLECYVLDQYIVEKPAETEKKDQAKVEEKGKKGKKKRPHYKVDKVKLCLPYISMSAGSPPVCNYTNCKFSHDVKAYMDIKPQDVGTVCPIFASLGHCERGITCRFAGSHLDENLNNLKNEEIYTGKPQTRIQIDKESVTKLRKHDYDFGPADKACNQSFDILRKREENEKLLAEEKERLANVEATGENGLKTVEDETEETKCSDPDSEKVKLEDKDKLSNDEASDKVQNIDIDEIKGPETKKAKLEDTLSNSCPDLKESAPEKNIGFAPTEDLIPLKPKEKKKLDWKDKLYLAPLTTVGNLPFRRLCKTLGADITCSEMALGLPLLQGHGAEWALLQRHHSEDFFGVQVCGCSPPQMSRVAQLLEDKVDCDFVDINMGCPIDLVFKKGMGSGLMIRHRPVEIISRTMASLMSRPLTIKMRTGVYKDKNVAHTLFPKLETLGVAALTIHGRSREQRYTKLADWEYIKECRETVDIPVFGNGDILNYEDYYAHKNSSGVDGIMLARGALIKPWLFTEIKEKRHWDISSSERLDIVKDFANYGLEHWGSDDRGLETTRKFLLEWLSFAYRYVPFGILKCPPQRINERLPFYAGRNELETLLSSPNSKDWVKITEMFLGKVKDDFEFVARHRANSYG